MTALNEQRLALRANGYFPIPLAGKAPKLPDWPSRCAVADEAEITRWGEHAAWTNTGLLCGHLIGVDIDVLDETLAATVIALAESRLGATPLLRIGRAPKAMLIYRSVAAPAKRSTPKTVHGQVEILARGQQLVAYGIHPDTGRPYSWPRQTPLQVPFPDLPLVTEHALDEFLHEASALLAPPSAPDDERATTPPPRPNGAHRVYDEPALVREALNAIPNNDADYDFWIRVGLALEGALGPAGFEAWRAWSQRSSKYHAQTTLDKWRSFKARDLKAGTIFFLARQHGWEGAGGGTAEANGHATGASEAPIDEGAEIARLAKLGAFDYDRARKAAAKRLGVSLGVLDRVVGAEREENEGGGDVLPDFEPWPTPVDGAELLSDLAATVLRHVGVPKYAEQAIALWILHAHALDAARISPRLAVTSPSPECGKTTLLALIRALVPRALSAANLTSAVTFRAITKWLPTLLIDEADTFLGDNDELRGVLNSGHKRETAFVLRSVGDDHEPKSFTTWAPVAIGLIGSLPATLASRSVHIEMKRLLAGETVEAFRPDKSTLYQNLGRKAARWAADNLDALRDDDPVLPEGFSGRRADNWRPLLAIADRAGGAWPASARAAAEALDQPDAGQTAPIMLLADLRQLFIEKGTDRLTSAEIVTNLGELTGRPWPEWGRSNRPITANAVSKLLKPFGITPDTIRVGAMTLKGYLLVSFEEAFSRYLPPVSGASKP